MYNYRTLGTLVLSTAIIAAYATGFTNSVSNMVPPWKSDPFFSLSSAMHFGNKTVVIPLLLLGGGLLTFSFLHTNSARKSRWKNRANALLILVFALSLVSVMFKPNLYGCDCTMANLEPCCTGKRVPGECTYENLDPKFSKSPTLGDPVCCNQPICTEKHNTYMAHRHGVITVLIALSSLTFMLLNKSYRIAGVYVTLLLLLSLDKGGDKLKLLFDTGEFTTVALFLASVYISKK
jgi:hypothetical protein